MFENLCTRLTPLGSDISLECNANVGLWPDTDLAIPLSLIANELVTNVLRHAFSPGVAGVVSFTVVVKNGIMHMIVADEGGGLPVSPMRPGLGSGGHRLAGTPDRRRDRRAQCGRRRSDGSLDFEAPVVHRSQRPVEAVSDRPKGSESPFLGAGSNCPLFEACVETSSGRGRRSINEL
jgi:hypothetical protein